MLQDLRLAWRALRSNPILSTIAVLSLALGIGANTAVFSLIDALVLRALPAAEPSRLAMLGGPSSPNGLWNYVTWEQVQQR